jgi:hypothetical protein
MASSAVIGSPSASSSREVSPEPKPKKFHNGWTKEQEKLMADWADIAMCYRWLHDKGEAHYRSKNIGMSIPVILLSTVTGSGNLGLDTFFGNDVELKRYATIGIGVLSLLAGLLTTLGNFFRFAQLSEAHRVASIAWGKFQRQISVELRIHPNERIDSMDFLKICRTEIDRLIEQSPPIPEIALKEFEAKFGHINDIKKPEICNQLTHTIIFEDTESRLKKVAAEAALMLRHKKNLLKELVMPEFETTVENKVIAERARMEREIKAKLESDLEARVAERVAERIDEIKGATPIAPPASIDSGTAYRGRSKFDFAGGGGAAGGQGIELASGKSFRAGATAPKLNTIIDPLNSGVSATTGQLNRRESLASLVATAGGLPKDSTSKL